ALARPRAVTELLSAARPRGKCRIVLAALVLEEAAPVPRHDSGNRVPKLEREQRVAGVKRVEERALDHPLERGEILPRTLLVRAATAAYRLATGTGTKGGRPGLLDDEEETGDDGRTLRKALGVRRCATRLIWRLA